MLDLAIAIELFPDDVVRVVVLGLLSHFLQGAF